MMTYKIFSWLIILICFPILETVHGQDWEIRSLLGEAIYQRHCLRCHGETGNGKGPDSAALMVPPRDFHSPESTGKTDLELRAIIIWGLVFSPMHGWWDRLDSDEIRAVIRYIRELAPYQPRI